jgi:hypothetical protein
MAKGPCPWVGQAAPRAFGRRTDVDGPAFRWSGPREKRLMILNVTVVLAFMWCLSVGQEKR